MYDDVSEQYVSGLGYFPCERCKDHSVWEKKIVDPVFQIIDKNLSFGKEAIHKPSLEQRGRSGFNHSFDKRRGHCPGLVLINFHSLNKQTIFIVFQYKANTLYCCYIL